MYDYHLHSSFSFDGKDSPRDFVTAAQKNGIKEICFCEHIEIDHNYAIEWDGRPSAAEYTKAVNDVTAYAPVIVKLGYEAGLTPNNITETLDFVRNTKCDFIIASCHFIDGKDPYDESDALFIDKDIKKVMESYLSDILYCIKNFDCFNVIGHIGYAGKYANPPQPLLYRDFSEIIDQILLYAIEKGKGIEINTSAWDIFGCGIPETNIIKRFFQLGGEIITTGSDSHISSSIGFHIKDAENIIKDCGGKYVCTFDNMQPVFHKI